MKQHARARPPEGTTAAALQGRCSTPAPSVAATTWIFLSILATLALGLLLAGRGGPVPPTPDSRAIRYARAIDPTPSHSRAMASRQEGSPPSASGVIQPRCADDRRPVQMPSAGAREPDRSPAPTSPLISGREGRTAASPALHPSLDPRTAGEDLRRRPFTPTRLVTSSRRCRLVLERREGRFVLGGVLPAETTRVRRRPAAGEGRYVLEVQDERGRMLSTHRFDGELPACGGADSLAIPPVEVDLPPGANRILIYDAPDPETRRVVGVLEL